MVKKITRKKKARLGVNQSEPSTPSHPGITELGQLNRSLGTPSHPELVLQEKKKSLAGCSQSLTSVPWRDGERRTGVIVNKA
jgi:hypothetical protein